MKFQNVVFGGGANTKIADHLLEATQAVECLNIDTERGSIYPLDGWTLVDAIDGRHATDVGGLVVSNIDEADDRSYVYFANRTYYTNGTFGSYGLMRINSALTSVNATAPTVTVYGTLTPTATTDGLLNGNYAYRYTVIDSEGIESAPSPIVYISAVADKAIDISITADTVNETVSKRRIYRTGGSNPTFNLIAEIDDLVAPYTFTDNTSDINVSRTELTTFSDYAPPQDITNLVENNGTFFASVGNRVHFSRSGQPEYWSGLDFIILHAECTGLGVFRDSIVAFTENDAYLISGYDRDTITLERLPFQEGCKNHHNIAPIGDLLMWTSNNGVCAYNGSSIDILTRNIFDWKNSSLVNNETFDSFESTFDSNLGSNIVYAAGVRGKYYGVMTDSILVVDTNNGIRMSTIDIDRIVSLFYNGTENKIQAIAYDETEASYISYAFDTDTKIPMLAKWKSGRIMGEEGYGIIKDYRKISFDKAPKYVRVYIDGTKRLFVENQKEFHLPSGCIGHSLQFELGTYKEIRSMKVQYGVQG